MLHLIPIHNAIYLYAVASFVLLAVSTQPVIGLLHARWLVNFRIKVVNANAFYKGLIVIWGFYFIPVSALFDTSFFEGISFLLAGICLGWCISKMEKNFVRRFFRYQFFHDKKIKPGNQLE